MTVLGVAILTVGSGVYQVIAQRMSISGARSPKVWMLLAAFLGPLPLAVLAVIPTTLQAAVGVVGVSQLSDYKKAPLRGEAFLHSVLRDFSGYWQRDVSATRS
jgi:hypothetical protein